MKARLMSAIFFGVVVFAALAGCASKSVKSDFTFKDDQSDGLVFFSVSHDLVGTTNTKVIFYFDGGPVSGGSMVYSLSQNPLLLTGYPGEFEDSHGQLVTLALPVGKHQITCWQVTGTGGVRLGPTGALPPLEFSVQPGQVRYLGDLHANLRMGKNLLGLLVVGDAYPEVRDKRDRDVELFNKKYPQFKDKVTFDPLALGPWIADSGTSRRVDIPPPLTPVRHR